MTYQPGVPVPVNLTARHRTELDKARAYLESIASRHPEWIIKKHR